jgi:aspartate/methionine/tyrosine aminotransferase
MSPTEEPANKRQRLPLASRLGRLGTETAYNISRDCALLRAQGKTIYGMHIGDLDFKPPTEFSEEVGKYYECGRTGYCLARGIPELRAAIAQRVLRDRGVQYTEDEVIVQAGGKPTILKFLLALMNEGDKVMYPSPGYPLYESLINFLGGVAVPYSFKDTGKGLAIDLDELKGKMSNAKLFIYNNMHNPTGYVSSPQEMEAIAKLCVENDVGVLSDEAYCSIFYDERPKSIVSYPGMRDRSVILLTCSKEWAMTGIRLGAAIGPKHIIDVFEKLAINDEGCTCQPSQWAAVKLFDGTCDHHTKRIVDTLRTRRDLLHQKVNQIPGFRAYLPTSSFYMWVNVTEAAKMLGTKNHEDFRLKLLNDTGVAFCTREHFGAVLPGEDEIHIRFAFAGASEEIITKSMDILREYIQKAGKTGTS